MEEFAASTVLRNLTPSQRDAVTCIDGPLLILAGPGSGKTRVITHRLAYMLEQGIAPQNMLALTFTNKAAEEMKHRLARLAPNRPVWMGTFHKFCARLLRQHAHYVGLHENFTIYDSDDSRKQLKLAIEEARIDLTHATPDAIASQISWAKNNLQRPQDYQAKPGSAVGKLVESIYPVYAKRMLQANAVDFDDLLLHVAVMLRENPEIRATLDDRYRYIMVDEYQDTNFAQYAIIRALSVDFPNLAVTGDPDQSIYGWRGANLNNILDFERDYPHVNVVKLEQNYRSTKAILRVADALIVNNRKRKHKDLFTDNAEGNAVRLMTYPSQHDEAEHIAEQIATAIHLGKRRASDFAIFYRMNALSRQIEMALVERSIPYQIVHGLEFYQRKEIKDVIAYLHMLNNPAADIPLLRIINTPTRGIGKSTIEKIQEHAQRFNITLLEACRESGMIESLSKKSAVSVAKFVALMDSIAAHIHEPLEAIIGHVLAKSGYREALQNSDSEEDQERLANIEELLTAAREFDDQHPEDGSLELFLEHSALVADTDAFASDSDKVTLMTLHAAKGLEFPCVFIMAVEEGILPHERSKDIPDKLEEERRLLFVGITRAEEELQISHADSRSFRGRNWPTVPSHFLMELPREEMEMCDATPSRNAHYEWQDEAADDYPDFVHEVDAAPSDADEYSQVEPEPKSKQKTKTFAPLVTGAEILAQQHRNKTPLSAFHQGLVVRHPDYGIGEIVALSGSGPKRTATVKFFEHPLEEKQFRLLLSPLEPVEE
jgi:DNA helicase II / ATP-dependent DNA helicase PcrA